MFHRQNVVKKVIFSDDGDCSGGGGGSGGGDMAASLLLKRCQEVFWVVGLGLRPRRKPMTSPDDRATG